MEAAIWDAQEDALLAEIAKKERDYENMEGQYAYDYSKKRQSTAASSSTRSVRSTSTGRSRSTASLRYVSIYLSIYL